MNRILTSGVGILFAAASIFWASSDGEFQREIPWMFKSQPQSFFYTPFCRKYKCIDNTSMNYSKRNLERFGIGDARYTNYFDIEVGRSKLGTGSLWPTGATLIIVKAIRYDKLTADLSKRFLDKDTNEIISDLMYELIGKKYPKERIIRCLKTNEKSVDIYYLDEFLKFPPTAPITKVSSGQGVPLYLKVFCDRTNESTLSVELSP